MVSRSPTFNLPNSQLARRLLSLSLMPPYFCSHFGLALPPPPPPPLLPLMPLLLVTLLFCSLSLFSVALFFFFFFFFVVSLTRYGCWLPGFFSRSCIWPILPVLLSMALYPLVSHLTPLVPLISLASAAKPTSGRRSITRLSPQINK